MIVDGEIPLTFRELIQRDRADYEAYLMKHCLVPRYKARILFKLGYSEADVMAGKHFQQFPSWDYSKRREPRKEAPALTRGKALSWRRIEQKMVHAMRRAGEEILAGHSLPEETRDRLKQVIRTLLERETKLKEKS